MSINVFIIYPSIEMKYSIHTVEAYKHDLRADNTTIPTRNVL